MSKLFALSILGWMLLACPVASSTPLTDVGGIDTFIDSTTLANSGDETELNWAKYILNDPLLTLDEKYDYESSNWSLVSGESDIYSTHFTTSPSYFLLKFGNGGTTYDSHYLLENIGDINYGVVDFSDLGIELIGNFSIDRLSHTDEFAGITTTNIAEPMSFTLFLLALLAFRIFYKRSF